jgi:hypothetical protein
MGLVHMTVDNPHIKVRDIRGVVVEPGCEVVVPGLTGSGHAILLTYRVRAIERRGTASEHPDDRPRIYVEGAAGYYTDNQVAVLPVDPTTVTTFDPGEQVPWNGEWKGLLTPEEEIAAHVVTVGTDNGGWRAKCPCGAEFPWHQIIKGPRKAKSAAQQDAIDHMAEVRRRAHGEEYTRADGRAICVRCTRTYAEHPSEEWEGSTGDLADSPLTLHRLCDRRLVKL